MKSAWPGCRGGVSRQTAISSAGKGKRIFAEEAISHCSLFDHLTVLFRRLLLSFLTMGTEIAGPSGGHCFVEGAAATFAWFAIPAVYLEVDLEVSLLTSGIDEVTDG